MPIKSQSKTTKKRTCPPSPRTVPIEKRTGTDVEPRKYSLSYYEISKKLIHLLRHGQHAHREDDGAVQFWRIKENLQTYFLYCPHWSDSKWKKSMARLILQEQLSISELFKDTMFDKMITVLTRYRPNVLELI